MTSSEHIPPRAQLAAESLFEIPTFNVKPLPPDARQMNDPWQMIVDSVADYEESDIPLIDAANRGRLRFARIIPNSFYPDAAGPLEATQLSLEEMIVAARDHAINIELNQGYCPDRIFIVDADRRRIRQIRASEPDPTIVIPDTVTEE